MNLSKNIIIPEEITKELAELCGIIAGDGHITYYKKNGDYKVEISGNHKELEYFNYIKNLFVQLFNKTPTIRFEEDELRLYLSSKKIVEKLMSLGLPAGKKKYIIRIPTWALSNKELGANFLRGLADTDFSVCFKGSKHSYPTISVGLCSKKLIDDIKILLDYLKITYSYLYRKKKTNFGIFDLYELCISGEQNLHKWVQNVGFSNPKHLTKIAIWKKIGHYEPHTPYKERLELLKQ